jgi:hypothetical protein
VKIKGLRPDSTTICEPGTQKFSAKIVKKADDISQGIDVTDVQFQFNLDTPWETVENLVFEPSTKNDGDLIAKAVIFKSVSENLEWRVRAILSNGFEEITGWQSLNVKNTGPIAPTTSAPVPAPVPTTNAPVVSPTTSAPVVAPTLEGPPIDALIADIRAVISSFGNPLRAKFVRLGFHDCVGGCDGCVNLSNPDNNGLELPIDQLAPIVDQYTGTGITRADVWAIAAMVGANDSQAQNNAAQDYEVAWYGRPTCNDITGKGGPDPELPSADLDSRGLGLFFLNEFQFTPRDTAAILGAHSLGELSQTNSGFTGQWVRRNEVLDNVYYSEIVGAGDTLDEQLAAPNWTVEQVLNNAPIPDRFQWRRGGAGSTDERVFLNADIALVRDFENHIDTTTGEVSCAFRANRNNSCPHATQFFEHSVEFRNDNAAFLLAFHDTFMRVLHQNSDRQDARTTCSSPPCQLV